MAEPIRYTSRQGIEHIYYDATWTIHQYLDNPVRYAMGRATAGPDWDWFGGSQSPPPPPKPRPDYRKYGGY